MTKVYYSPKECNQEILSLLDTNIKADRTPKDVLFQDMLKLGIPLASRIKATTLHGKKIFKVYCVEAMFLMARLMKILTKPLSHKSRKNAI